MKRFSVKSEKKKEEEEEERIQKYEILVNLSVLSALVVKREKCTSTGSVTKGWEVKRKK